MKRGITTLIILLLALSACDNKRDHNGDLGGMWQLTEWRSPEGTTLATKADQIFYSVQLNLIRFRDYDDGTLGSTFAIDAQFGIEQPEKVLTSFTDGAGARVARLLQEWGIADDRLQLGVQSTFARALPMGREGDTLKLHSLALMPQWAKVRWINAQLQPAKLYCLANASPLDRKLES